MNIVIAGGGTAGWLAALFISKTQPNSHNVTVIASSKIGIIGAGENATGLFKSVLDGRFFNLNIDINDFMDKTEATYKNGILNVNWTKDGSDYFTPLGCCPSYQSGDDVIFKYALANDKKNMHTYTDSGYLYSKGRWEEDLQSFHFNSHKAGEYLKNLCLESKVKVIDSVISEVELSNTGDISGLRTESGDLISGELFIDATGFSRLLMKKLGINWKSYKDILPVDRAIPFFLDDPELMKKRYTTATALSSGWMWNVPLQTRVGAGYTYDSNYLTEEDAIHEVEEYLGYKVNPIKVIKFDAGRTEVTWVKNCVAVGLSQSFVEPLEATSIHSTIAQLIVFVNEVLLSTWEKTNNPISKKKFNELCDHMGDATADFISLHYQGGRTDTPFWKHMTENKVVTEFTAEVIELAKNKIPSVGTFRRDLLDTAPICLWNWTLAGLNLLTPEVAKESLVATGNELQAKTWIDYFFKRLN